MNCKEEQYMLKTLFCCAHTIYPHFTMFTNSLLHKNFASPMFSQTEWQNLCGKETYFLYKDGNRFIRFIWSEAIKWCRRVPQGVCRWGGNIELGNSSHLYFQGWIFVNILWIFEVAIFNSWILHIWIFRCEYFWIFCEYLRWQYWTR